MLVGDASLDGAVMSLNSRHRSSTEPVGSLKPNGPGLYDTRGNVMEWCLDRYGNYPGGSVRDPIGPASGSKQVYRGGGLFSSAQRCRSGFRGWNVPGGRSPDLGFRLALSSVP